MTTPIYSVGSTVRVKANPKLPEGIFDQWVGVEGIVVEAGHSLPSGAHSVKVTVDPLGAGVDTRVGATFRLVNLELIEGTVLNPDPEKPEAVDHPAHYGGDTPYEVIKVAEAWGLDKDAYLFNVLKYIGRFDKKGTPLQDLEKAQSYLTRRINNMKEGK